MKTKTYINTNTKIMKSTRRAMQRAGRRRKNKGVPRAEERNVKPRKKDSQRNEIQGGKEKLHGQGLGYIDLKWRESLRSCAVYNMVKISGIKKRW
jgi:hypothetical protein